MVSDANEFPKKEHPSTYFVQNREDKTELQRLTIQDRMTTTLQGGLFPERDDLANIQHILDVGCGAGIWAVDVALQYPHISLVGVDISQQMISYARSLVEQYDLASRVEFYTMDALRMLEFSDETFDLVTMRFGASFMRTWDWQKLLSEMQRVLKPGGTIRLIEAELLAKTSSAAMNQQVDMFRNALYRSGHLFANEPEGISDHLADILKKYGGSEIQTKKIVQILKAGTPEAEANYEDMKRAIRLMQPFIQKWGTITGDYDALYQQILVDLQKPDYYSTWVIMIAWGVKPGLTQF